MSDIRGIDWAMGFDVRYHAPPYPMDRSLIVTTIIAVPWIPGFTVSAIAAP